MSTLDQVETPSRTLAQQIIDRLVAEGLINTKDGVKLQLQLAEGKLRASDWRLAVELGAEKEAKQ